MTADEQLIERVRHELARERSLESKAIAVAAVDGRVTLRGTVGGADEKQAARNAAASTFGVVVVHDKLDVRALNAQKRDDADLRAEVLQALMLNRLVPATIDAEVDHGLVSLTGTARFQYERDEADLVASSIVGELDLVDEVELTARPSSDPAAVKEAIRRAFARRNAEVDADELEVSAENGTVTISGRVHSWAAHDEVLAAALTTPGIGQIRDAIAVTETVSLSPAGSDVRGRRRRE